LGIEDIVWGDRNPERIHVHSLEHGRSCDNVGFT
jgi:hypothetical protein